MQLTGVAFEKVYIAAEKDPEGTFATLTEKDLADITKALQQQFFAKGDLPVGAIVRVPINTTKMMFLQYRIIPTPNFGNTNDHTLEFGKRHV